MDTLSKGEIMLIIEGLKSYTAPVPKGLCASFYHTLTYHGDCELKSNADNIVRKLKQELT